MTDEECALLQRVERANPIRLRQTIVLAAVDHQLRRRPLVHIIYRVELFQHLLCFLIPRPPTPVVVELIFSISKSGVVKVG
jgi:hypothetical protein